MSSVSGYNNAVLVEPKYYFSRIEERVSRFDSVCEFFANLSQKISRVFKSCFSDSATSDYQNIRTVVPKETAEARLARMANS